MDKTKLDKQYPMISVRVKREQFEYIRRECESKNLSLADYVRAVLFPFDSPTIK